MKPRDEDSSLFEILLLLADYLSSCVRMKGVSMKLIMLPLLFSVFLLLACGGGQLQVTDAIEAQVTVNAPAAPVIPNRSLSVATYGAIPNDNKDDTKAIQKAIDAMRMQGGGSVLFSPGQYDISIQPKSSTCEPSLTSSACKPHPQALVLYSKLRLASSDATNRATLRLKNNQGNYESVMATAEYWFALEDFVLENIIVDGNGSNNPVNRPANSDPCCDNSPDFGVGYDQTPRYALRVYLGARVLVNNVRFLGQTNVNVITLNGDPFSDGEIKNSSFEGVGNDPVDFDHSSIYTTGKRIRVINNTFTSKAGLGTKGARTAIEIHGDDQLVDNNKISGFTFGVNVVGDTATGGARQVYTNNTIDGVVSGFVIWAFPDDSYAGKTLKGIEIRNNKITLNGDAWLNADLTFDALSVSGIQLEAANESPIASLTIADNTITFTNVTGFRSNFAETRSGGMVFSLYQNPQLGIDRLIIARNRIENALGPGVFISVPIGSDALSRIVGNIIISPARGNELRYDEAKDTRAGIYIAKETQGSAKVIPVTTKNLELANNTIQDTAKPSKLAYGVSALSSCTSNCVLRTNRVSPLNVQLYNFSQSWTQQ
jgi:Pectate lyase superfamily protein